MTAMTATIARKYTKWGPGAWARTLPESYFTQMEALVDEVTKGWFSDKDVAEGYADYVRARYIFGRMEICQTRILPWLTAAVPHLGRVLEVGCGNGSATAVLAPHATHLHAFDLAADQVAVATKRCALLGVDNVTAFALPVTWIDSYVADPAAVAPAVDTIVCYALFEHLTPTERIKFLIGAWRHLPVGGRLVIIETPNRLYYFDWHSSQIPFQDQLPPEIAFLWNGFSGRASIPADIRASTLAEMEKGNVDRLYRFGRGASFHEFYAALGPDNFRVLNRSILNRTEFPHWNQAYIDLLDGQFAAITPRPDVAFAQPCLDLILEKTGESRMPAV